MSKAFTTYETDSSQNGVTFLFGSFTPANGASPTASTIRGNCISTVARTAEGLWTVTLKDRFMGGFNLVFAAASYQNTTADAGAANIAEVDLSAGTVKLAGWLAHVADDLAGGTPTIRFMLAIQSSQIKDGGGY
jgi:glucose/arabinose dehydrogenase